MVKQLSLAELNAKDLERELTWFARLLDTRFKLYFQQETEYTDICQVTAPDLSKSNSIYADFVYRFGLSFEERTALILSLVPNIRPQLLDVFLTKNKTFDRKFTEFGGVLTGQENDFLSHR